MSYCIKCGKQNPDTAKFCTGCGGSLTAAAPPQSLKNKNNQWVFIAAIVLAVIAAGYFIFFNDSKEKSSLLSNNRIDEDVTTKLKGKVQEWNNALNLRDDAAVSAMYADRLVYYRSSMLKEAAQEILDLFFATSSGYSQQITGEITIEKINDNLFVCNFNKTVTRNGTTTDYPSYLKFSQQGTIWKIVEEGDKITDYNINKNK